MSSITLQEAQSRLEELIDQLRPGEEIVITRDEQPVARLTSANHSSPVRRRLGTMKGSVLHVAPDFDAPLDDFREYSE